MSKIGLVIIFNHPYAKNLEKLRSIYGERFSILRFLMPFYDGNEPDVCPDGMLNKQTNTGCGTIIPNA